MIMNERLSKFGDRTIHTSINNQPRSYDVN